MNLALSIAAIVLVLAGLVVAAWSLRPGSTSKPRMPQLLDRTLVVHTRNDETIRGALHAHGPDLISLRGATYHAEDKPTVEIHGVVQIPVEAIAWMEEIQA